MINGAKTGTLIFFSGKMGAGKSTRAAEIAKIRKAILLSEDEWLGSLYPNQIKTLNDYVQYSNLLKPQIKKLVQAILKTGVDVVMDFPANTITQRTWFRKIFNEAQAPHILVYIDVSDDVCLKQIEKRRGEQPERVATDTAEMFARVTKHFVAPSLEEGFVVHRISR